MHTKKIPLSRYYPIGKIGFLTMMAFRWECVFASLASAFTLVFSYYLWSAVYAASDTLGSYSSFETTFLYVALSLAIVVTFNTSTESRISSSIISGDVIREIVRPISFHGQQVANAIGITAMRIILVFIPCLIIAALMLESHPPLSNNIALFPVSLVFSFLILLHIDMLAGLIAVRTEAVWGIRFAKEYVVLAFSGALIPLYILPGNIQGVLMYLPFQGICHTPMTILLDKEASIFQIVELLLVQASWAFTLIYVIHYGLKRQLRRIEMNGG